MSLKDVADDLPARRARTLEMGGADAVAKQHGAGKRTARERIVV